MTDKKNPLTSTTKKTLQDELPKAPVHAISLYTKYPIHDTLKQLRKEADLTLEALSLVTKGVDPDGKGISRVSLSRYEASTEPGLRELKILAWAFRKPIAYLVYGYMRDPLAEDQRDTLELIVEDIVCDTVITILEQKGLIKKERSADSQNYERLLSVAKQLAKK